jgi:hypothetical protein
MNKTIPIYLVFLTLLGGYGGCGFKPDKVETPRWTTEILAPLVKAPLSAEEIVQLKDITFSQEVKMSDIGVPNGNYPMLPPIPPVSLPPYTLSTSADIASVTFASGKMAMTIQNNLPINLKAGATITIEAGTSVFFTHTLPNDINPGTTYIMTPEYDVAGKTINENVTLKVNNFASDGSSSSVTINGSEKLTVSFSIKGLKVQNIGLASNNSFELADTANFSITGSSVKTGEISGKFVLFADNQMPVQMNVQAYFLDSTKKVIDSLFVGGTQSIIAATVDGSGFSNTTLTSSINIPVSTEKFEKIKPAKYLRSYAKVSTGSGAPLVFIRNTDKLTLQLVADIKVKIENKEN